MAESNRHTADAIKDSLKARWADADMQENCSGFLKQVALDQGITLEGDANTMIEHISTQWRRILTAAEAADEAAKGSFVVAVLKGNEHADKRYSGHVAIVLSGAPQQRGSGATGGSYPLVWCAGRPIRAGAKPGQSGGQSDGTRTVGDVWRGVDRNQVKYFKYPKW